MREIKFRAWDKINKRIINFESIGCVALDDCIRGVSSKYELQQYTGIKDKNMVDIYEGDIVNMDKTEIDVVKFVNGEYITKKDWDYGNYCIGEGVYGGNNYLEVIGNIHENPELLKN